jgi:hypothetical protein
MSLSITEIALSLLVQVAPAVAVEHAFHESDPRYITSVEFAQRAPAEITLASGIPVPKPEPKPAPKPEPKPKPDPDIGGTDPDSDDDSDDDDDRDTDSDDDMDMDTDTDSGSKPGLGRF